MRTLLFILVLVFSVSAQDPFTEGTILALNGQYEKALVNYRAAQNENRDAEASARVHYNIGVCLYHLDRPADAVPELKEAIRLKGDRYQQAWYALGMAQAGLKNAAGAREAFTRAIALDKKDAEAWFDLGLVLLDEKEFPAARAAFQKAVEFGSVNSPDAHNNIGVILAVSGDIAAAIKEFELSGSAEAAGNLKYWREQAERVANVHKPARK
jgi:tetratricopeptide (TPR) repeat protein